MSKPLGRILYDKYRRMGFDDNIARAMADTEANDEYYKKEAGLDGETADISLDDSDLYPVENDGDEDEELNDKSWEDLSKINDKEPL